jgi:hypothetical protein
MKSNLLATNTTDISFNWEAIDFPAGSRLYVVILLAVLLAAFAVRLFLNVVACSTPSKLVVLWGAGGSSSTWEMGTVVKSSQPCKYVD